MGAHHGPCRLWAQVWRTQASEMMRRVAPCARRVDAPTYAKYRHQHGTRAPMQTRVTRENAAWYFIVFHGAQRKDTRNGEGNRQKTHKAGSNPRQASTLVARSRPRHRRDRRRWQQSSGRQRGRLGPFPASTTSQRDHTPQKQVEALTHSTGVRAARGVPTNAWKQDTTEGRQKSTDDMGSEGGVPEQRLDRRSVERTRPCSPQRKRRQQR